MCVTYCFKSETTGDNRLHHLKLWWLGSISHFNQPCRVWFRLYLRCMVVHFMPNLVWRGAHIFSLNRCYKNKWQQFSMGQLPTWFPIVLLHGNYGFVVMCPNIIRESDSFWTQLLLYLFWKPVQFWVQDLVLPCCLSWNLILEQLSGPYFLWTDYVVLQSLMLSPTTKWANHAYNSYKFQDHTYTHTHTHQDCHKYVTRHNYAFIYAHWLFPCQFLKS